MNPLPRERHILTIFFALTALILVTSQVFALKNATLQIQKLDGNGVPKIDGVAGVINFSFPNLKGGRFSYQRVILQNTYVNRYVEMGWIRHHTRGDLPLLVYGTPGSADANIYFIGININTAYLYRILPSAATGGIFEHRVLVSNIDTGANIVDFSVSYNDGLRAVKGDLMVVGGETGAPTTGTEEDMVGNYNIGTVKYPVYFSRLQWLKTNSSGFYTYAKWKNPFVYLDEAPYDPYYIGYNSDGGQMKTCGKQTAQDCP